MAAEMVGSVVAQETVSQILSGLVQRYAESSDATRNLERLEMAHIRLEAALDASDRWQIADASLLRWRKKLRRVAQECDDVLHRCRQQGVAQAQEPATPSSSLSPLAALPTRIARATKSLIFSAFVGDDAGAPTRSTVQRFEWFADGAGEFLRYVEVGGGAAPRCHVPLRRSLTRHLFAGMELLLQHKIVWGLGRDECPSYLLWLVPSVTPDHGIEACLKFIHRDHSAPENNFFLGAMLQISESTDVVGTVVNCLRLFPPCFQPTIEAIKKELTQLPTQDFSWVPYVDLWHRKHWDNLHGFCTQWFRPDPLCCKKQQHHQQGPNSSSRPSWCSSGDDDPDMVGIPDVSLDSVILMHLECQVSVPSEYNGAYSYSKQKATTASPPYRRRCSRTSPTPTTHDSEYSPCRRLKAGLLFTPHGCTKHRLPEEKSSAVVTVYGEEQRCVHTDITLDQLNEIMLPKAADYFYRNPEATACQMLWKSRHGTEYIEFEKPRTEEEEEEEPPCARRAICRGGSRKRKLQLQVQQDQVQVLGSWNRKVACFLNSWVAHAPVRLRGLILDWIQRGKESQLAAPPPVHLEISTM